MFTSISRRRFVRVGLTALLGTGIAIASTACGTAGGGDDGRLKVVATTTQIGALAREVGGDRINLVTLLAAGADAHDFEPKAADVRKLSGAAVVLRNGIHLDEFLDKMIEGNSAAALVTVTEGITLHAPAGGDDHDDEDPHVWHDPMNAKVMVDNIAKSLSAADASNAATYTQNATAYKAKLDATDAQIKQLIDSIPPANRKIVTNHDAFGYFIRRYNLTYVGAILPASTQGEASAKDLAALQTLIKAEGVKAIFAESSIDAKVAKRIADDTKVKVVDNLYSDSLGRSGSGADTLDGMLLANARTIAEALR